MTEVQNYNSTLLINTVIISAKLLFLDLPNTS